MPRTTETGPARRRNALIDWILTQRLLRGPHLFVDYWANVLGIDGVVPEHHDRARLIDPTLFRAGLDRPDVEVPRLRFYLLLFVVGPLILPFRAFRRLGRYRLRFLGPVGEEVQRRLRAYRLRFRPAATAGRVDVLVPRAAAAGESSSAREPRSAEPQDPASAAASGADSRAARGGADSRAGRGGADDEEGAVLARDLIDPFRVSGFCSLFWAAYKLPLASFSAILLIAVLAPVLSSAGLLPLVAQYWVPVGFPLLVILLRLVYREWVTAVLGALPVLLGRYLLRFVQPATVEGWLPFFWPLVALFLLYLLFDLFFVPRPVPPALMLYTKDGPGRAYAREMDAPYWLDGRAYWVWRYLILSPAELNKFWERDWERVDLWIRADGPEAGRLEWVVTDLHYRELWIPYDRLGDADALARHRQEAEKAFANGDAGVWVVEVDADLLVHYPFIRGVAFLPDAPGLPVRGVVDLVRALWSRVKTEPQPAELLALERLRVTLGRDLLADVPEFLVRRVSRHLMSQPWRYWRYPLGAATRAEPRLYGRDGSRSPPPIADPELQIKS